MTRPSNKVTRAEITAKVMSVTYTVLPNGRTTICQLTMENGYAIIGQSSVVDIANFDSERGKEYAYKDAVNNMWPLEGYLLAEKLHIYDNDPKNKKFETGCFYCNGSKAGCPGCD